jgi:hypothetical protein
MRRFGGLARRIALSSPNIRLKICFSHRVARIAHSEGIPGATRRIRTRFKAHSADGARLEAQKQRISCAFEKNRVQNRASGFQASTHMPIRQWDAAATLQDDLFRSSVTGRRAEKLVLRAEEWYGVTEVPPTSPAHYPQAISGA